MDLRTQHFNKNLGYPYSIQGVIPIEISNFFIHKKNYLCKNLSLHESIS